jgi:SAM-dependent methyltransferase
MSDSDRAKWDARYRDEDHTDDQPSSFLAAAEGLLPASGVALDVAGGAGRNAVWLARRGFRVTVVDVSPVGLALARRRAAAAGVALATSVLDLERQPLPEGPWDVILVFHYLHRALLAEVAERLTPRGRLLFAHATRSNAARHPRPPLPFRIDDGEAPRLVRGLALVSYAEGWFAEGRHEARLVARRREPPR